LKLGDQVQFDRYYRKNGSFVDYEKLSPEYEKELDETDQIVLQRLDEVVSPQMLSGIVVGKRRMVLSNTLEYGQSRYNPDGSEMLAVVSSKEVEVYLIASNLSGFYRVPEDWLQSDDQPRGEGPR